jgi:hypothetical protein
MQSPWTPTCDGCYPRPSAAMCTIPQGPRSGAPPSPPRASSYSSSSSTFPSSSTGIIMMEGGEGKEEEEEEILDTGKPDCRLSD